MIRKNAFISLLLLGGFFMGCKEKTKAPQEITTAEIEFKKEAEVYLTKASGDTIKHLEIEIADDDYQRETGLMYRQKLEDTHGMLFIFENEEERGFYMKNTQIPLDLIFLDADQEVVSIAPDAKPGSLETIPSGVPAQYVLEVNAGLSEKWNLEVGDKLILNKD